MINEGKRMELGSQIKRHRTERGLSQDDLAAKIYVSRQTVSSWENDKTYLTWKACCCSASSSTLQSTN